MHSISSKEYLLPIRTFIWVPRWGPHWAFNSSACLCSTSSEQAGVNYAYGNFVRAVQEYHYLIFYQNRLVARQILMTARARKTGLGADDARHSSISTSE
jgi:hypothetical protein